MKMCSFLFFFLINLELHKKCSHSYSTLLYCREIRVFVFEIYIWIIVDLKWRVRSIRRCNETLTNRSPLHYRRIRGIHVYTRRYMWQRVGTNSHLAIKLRLRVSYEIFRSIEIAQVGWKCREKYVWVSRTRLKKNFEWEKRYIYIVFNVWW